MRFLVVAATLSMLAACGTESAPLASPTPAASVSPAAMPSRFQAMRLAGRVLDSSNLPVPGARMTPWDSGDTKTSDEGGTFDATFNVNPQGRSFWITVEKPGYETSELMRSLDTATATVLRLHRIRVATPGESISLSIAPDDSACGYHWGYVCRRVRITPSAPGTLAIEINSKSADILGIPVGAAGFPQSFERHLSLTVNVGAQVSVDVAAMSALAAPAEFTLTSSLTE